MTAKSTTKLYKTGEEAPHTGHYEFVKYVDGTVSPSPTANEKVIPLSKAENFPPIRSSSKAAWWRAV